MWRSRLPLDLGRSTQAIDSTVWEYNNESKNGNGIDCRFYEGTEMN